MRRDGKSKEDRLHKWIKDAQRGKWTATPDQIAKKQRELEALEGKK